MQLTLHEALFPEESCQRLRDGNGLMNESRGVTPFGRSGAGEMAYGQGEGGGSAAGGILMTLHLKRAIDSTVGSFLGKELPPGLRLADGNINRKRRRLSSFPSR